MKKYTAIIIALLTASFILSCSKNEQSVPDKKDTAQKVVKTTPDSTSSQKIGIKLDYKMSGILFDFNSKPVTVGGITYTPASQWVNLEKTKDRFAGYTFGPLEGDSDSATMYVYYYGEKQKSNLDNMLESWITSMTIPDGRDPHNAKIQYIKTVADMNVHILSMQAIYNVPAEESKTGQPIPKENYRLIGVVVEAPEGNIFFKLTGPEYTARIMCEAYITMIDKIKKTE